MAEGILCEGRSLEQDHEKVKVKCEECTDSEVKCEECTDSEVKCEECTDSEVKCEECIDSGDKAEGFCHRCAEFICKECMNSHKVMKLFASHEVITLEHLKKGQTRKIAVKEPPTKTCHIHEEEPLTIYCFDCDTFICLDCTEKEHKDHNFEFNKITSPEIKRNLLGNSSHLKLVSANIPIAIKGILATKQEVEAEEDFVANSIQMSFNELHQILDKCESKLLVESLRNLQDNKVMSIHTESHSQIQGEVEEHSKPGKIKEEAGEADMRVEVRCVEALQQLCQTNANITQLALDAALCTVRGEGMKTAEVHQAAKLTLTTKLTNSKTTRCSAVVVGLLKSLYDGSVFKCDVDQSRPGEYHIQYTPTVRGRHDLTVSVDGQQVAGSPFPVSVSIPPTQLGKPVKVLYGIHHAGGITINTVGDILVTECDGDIVKYNTKGKKSVLVTHSESEVRWLESISTDDKGSIYCTHSETNKVTKCTKNGQVHEVKQVTGSGHWSMTVVGDEVMMCEMNNEMVYDRELKYVRCIELHDRGEFTGMSLIAMATSMSLILLIIASKSSVTIWCLPTLLWP